jgi:Raf kinase inhibitor-like YbhB/YbcL family protein
MVHGMKMTSTAFGDGERIPLRHTGEGEDVSPPLAWSEVPADTVEFALICDDPDAPMAEPWVHWVLYKIPASGSALPAGVPRGTSPGTVAGMRQGRNSWPNAAYQGPLPPPGHGTHHYHFTLYALDALVEEQENLT